MYSFINALKRTEERNTNEIGKNICVEDKTIINQINKGYLANIIDSTARDAGCSVFVTTSTKGGLSSLKMNYLEIVTESNSEQPEEFILKERPSEKELGYSSQYFIIESIHNGFLKYIDRQTNKKFIKEHILFTNIPETEVGFPENYEHRFDDSFGYLTCIEGKEAPLIYMGIDPRENKIKKNKIITPILIQVKYPIYISEELQKNYTLRNYGLILKELESQINQKKDSSEGLLAKIVRTTGIPFKQPNQSIVITTPNQR